MMKILETLLKVKIGIVFFSIFFAGPTPLLLGNNDTVLIKSCINQMFEGMAAFDSSMVHRSFADGFLLRSVIKSKDGTIIVREESGDSFLKIIGTKKPGVRYAERLLSYTILIDGDMAIVWTPYHFYLTDIFSHCGVNAFTVVKLPEGWKILSITDTRRKGDCAE